MHVCYVAPSRLGGFAKIIYFLLLAGGIYYYCSHMLWEKPQPVDVPEEDAFLAPVQVRELPGRGMGVIATKDIQVRRSQHIDHPLGSHDGITHIAWGAGPSREAVVCGAEQR